ncbi:MAG: hypothetical protein Q8L78_02725 [Coxiellaceae bacterium]|nr:hypothetical protein [Coxiellaceae bacterium]
MALPSGAHKSFRQEAFSIVIKKGQDDKFFPVFAHTETEDLAALKAEIPALAGKFTELEGSATYTHKIELIKSLRRILQRLRGELNHLYGLISDDEKEKIRKKLCEEIACHAGLHDRAEEIILSFDQPKNFAELLQIAREDIVQRLGVSLLGEVHAANTMTHIAHDQHYGVRQKNKDDEYVGDFTPAYLEAALKNTFSEKYTPFLLPFLLLDFLRTQLATVYTGAKKEGFPTEEDQLNDIYGFDIGDLKKMTAIIEKYLPVSKGERSGIDNSYFIIVESEDGISSYHKDINWQYILKQIFKKLKDDYCDKTKPLVPTTLEELAAAFSLEAIVTDETIASVFRNFNTDFGNNAALLTVQYRRNPEGFKTVFERPEFISLLDKIAFEEVPQPIIETLSLDALLNIYFKQHSNVSPTINDLYPILVEKIAAESSDYKYIAALLNLLAINATDMSELIRWLTPPIKEGKNGFYWWMNALSWACHNKLAAAPKMIDALIQLIAKTPDPAQLIQGLSETVAEGEDKGKNGFYWWMNALSWACQNNLAAAPKMIDALIQLIAKTPDPARLIQGLSEIAAESLGKGKNGFYWWMSALSWACQNNLAAAPKMIDALIQLIAKTPDPARLIQGLSEIAVESLSKGKNGFYWWMNALSLACENKLAAAPTMIDALMQLIAKTNDPTQLIQGLSETAAEGPNKGENGFYCWMNALALACQNNPLLVFNITDAALTLIEKDKAAIKPIVLNFTNNVLENLNTYFVNTEISFEKKLRTFHLVIHFANFFNHSSKTTDSVAMSESLKKIYFSLFKSLEAPEAQASFNACPSLLLSFFETSASKKYLQQYCEDKIKNENGMAWHREHLKPGTLFSLLIDKQRNSGLFATKSSATRLALNKIVEKMQKAGTQKTSHSVSQNKS